MTVASTGKNDDCPEGGSSPPRGDSSASDGRGEVETTPGDVSVGQGCAGGRRGTAAAAAVAAAPASDKVDDRGSSVDGTTGVPAPSDFLPAPTAAVALASSMSDLSCEEPIDNPPPVTGDKNGKESSEDINNKDGGGSKGFADRRRLPEPGPLTLESLSGVELVCGDIFREAW